MAHKYNAIEFQARMESKTDLAQSHVPPHAVPGVVERLTWLEIYTGIVGE